MGMVCLLACCCGCSGRPEGAVRLPIVRIDTVGVYGTPRTVQFPGCVRAAQEVNAAFKVGGTLRTIFAEEGEFVRRGAPLAALDARDYRLQAEAAEAEYKRVKAEAERVMALYADGAATPDAYDKARYGLQQITAKYENSRNQLADTEIRMPFDGYVQKRLFDPSTVVGAGMPVLTVVSAEAPEIEINIPGSEYVRRSEFDGFEAAFDFWPGKRIPLRLRSISPKANANQLYTLRLGVPADLRPLPSPGMNTMVTIVCRAFGGCAGGRAGRLALRRRRPDVRLDLPGGQYGREPRGTGRAVADRRRSGRRSGTCGRRADRHVGRAPAA